MSLTTSEPKLGKKNTRWKPGQSGNAHGANRKYRGIVHYCQINSRAMAATLVKCANDPTAPWASRIGAAMAVLDRAFGKPKETVTVENEGGAPMLTVCFVAPDGSEAQHTITLAPGDASQPAPEQPAEPAFTLKLSGGK